MRLAVAVLAVFSLLSVDPNVNWSGGRGCVEADAMDSQALDSLRPMHAAELTLTVKSLGATTLETTTSCHSSDTGATAMTIVRKHQTPPQVLRICEPHAVWIAVNIRECNLLRGDHLELRGGTTSSRNRSDRVVTLTAKNASIAERAWQNASFWNHPFVFPGDTVTIAYFPSIATLMLPIPTGAKTPPPVLAIASYVVATPVMASRFSDDTVGSRGSSDALTTGPSPAPTPSELESIVGNASELREAVCYKKTAPTMYAKARTVARLLIEPQTSSGAATVDGDSAADSLFGNSPLLRWWPWRRRGAGQYCTGWLVGRGNHLMTNYHCLTGLDPSSHRGVTGKDTTMLIGCRGTLSASASASASAASDSSGSLTRRGTADLDARMGTTAVNFMAETKRCQDVSTKGEKLGTIEATNVTVVAASSVLDYALLRIHPNDSNVDLARKYGYLELRRTGPTDGEAIYIPQHPNGEAKEIAATKGGKPATIRVPSSSSGVPTSAGSASFSSSKSASSSSPLDSSSSTGGSSNMDATTIDTSDYNPINPNVFYNADTRPGSSGSPVLSQTDHKVVALHHAGGTVPIGAGDDQVNDFNAGVRIDLIVEDLRRQGVVPPCALARPCPTRAKDPCCRTAW